MNLTCPYCDHTYSTGYDNEKCEEHYQAECPACDNIFAYQIEIEITTISCRAECLNGGEHEWEIQKCYPEFMTRRYCACGESEYIYSMEVRKDMAQKYLSASATQVASPLDP